MKSSRCPAGFFALFLVLAASPLAAQAVEDFPLSPNEPRGQPVAPFFEGWYANPDGTYTLSFGYFNLNTRETVEIPLGEDNFIEPARFDGGQPSSFPPRRQRGVFSVTIPGDMAGEDVVWTLRRGEHTLSVPGRTTSPAYDLGYSPMAAGSLPPNLRFSPDGPSAYGVIGLKSETELRTTVGTPVSLTIWIDDARSQREPVPLNVDWAKHTGPGTVTFEPENHEEVETGEVTVAMTFSEAGAYVIRATADNFDAGDSSDGDQCCWTNGYVTVLVTE